MPFKKRYPRKTFRKTYRRKTYRRRTFSKYPRTELKLTSNGADAAAVAPAGVLYLLNQANKGTDQNDRVGQKTLVKSINIRGLLTNGNATTAQVRIILFIVKQPRGTAPTFDEMLDTVAVMSQRNVTTFRRQTILRDFVMTLSPLSLDSRDHKTFKIYKRLNLPVLFDDSDAGTVADIESNALYIGAFSDAAANVAMTWTGRTAFTDA